MDVQDGSASELYKDILGLGSQPRWTHPCEWQQRSNRAAMGCEMVLPQNPNGHTGWVISVAFSPDGQTLSNWQLRLISSTLNVQDEKLATLHDHTSEGCLSPNGRLLASVAVNHPAVDVQDGTCQKVLQGTSRVRGLVVDVTCHQVQVRFWSGESG